MAALPLGGDEMPEELEIHVEQSSTSEAEDIGNPPGDLGCDGVTSNGQRFTLPPLSTGIHQDFLVRHTADWTLVDLPQEANRASITDARSSDSRQAGPLLSEAADFCEPSSGAVGISQGFLARHSTDRYLALGTSLNRLSDHPLEDFNLCCHCLEEAVADCVFLPCFHKIHCHCVCIRIQGVMRTCGACGQVF